MRGRSGFGWSQFVMGICLILLGVFTCLRPGSIFSGIGVIYGIAAVITGICDIDDGGNAVDHPDAREDARHCRRHHRHL